MPILVRTCTPALTLWALVRASVADERQLLGACSRLLSCLTSISV